MMRMHMNVETVSFRYFNTLLSEYLYDIGEMLMDNNQEVEPSVENTVRLLDLYYIDNEKIIIDLDWEEEVFPARKKFFEYLDIAGVEVFDVEYLMLSVFESPRCRAEQLTNDT